MIQAFHQALQISVSLGTCIWDPIYQRNTFICKGESQLAWTVLQEDVPTTACVWATLKGCAESCTDLMHTHRLYKCQNASLTKDRHTYYTAIRRLEHWTCWTEIMGKRTIGTHIRSQYGKWTSQMCPEHNFYIDVAASWMHTIWVPGTTNHAQHHYQSPNTGFFWSDYIKKSPLWPYFLFAAVIKACKMPVISTKSHVSWTETKHSLAVNTLAASQVHLFLHVATTHLFVAYVPWDGTAVFLVVWIRWSVPETALFSKAR